MKRKTEQKHLDALNSCADYIKSLGLDFDANKIRSKSRVTDVVMVRAVIIAHLHRQGHPSAFIGACVNRDHATVLHNLKYAEKTRYGRLAPKVMLTGTIAEIECQIKHHKTELKLLNKKLTQYKKLKKLSLS